MSEKLERAKDEKVAFIHRLESVFEEETEELKETIEEQLGIIREMKTQKERLEMSLTEARVNDLVRNGRYNCLLEELEGLKEEYLNKVSEMEQRNLEMSEQLEKVEGEKVVSIHRLESVVVKDIGELEHTIEKQLGIIREMNIEKERLEMSLTEAKTKNLTNEGKYTCLVNELKDTKKEACRAEDDLSRALGEIGKLKKKNVGLKDELLAANEITSSLEEQLEGRDKKKEVSRPGTRKVRLDRSSLEISTEKDVRKDGQKDVQKDVCVNKEDEDKVDKAAEYLEANRHKEEKGVVGEASGVEEQKLQKETSPSEEEEEKEEEEKEEEEKKEEEKKEKEKKKEAKKEEKIVEKKTCS
ncbi:nucleolar protein 58-like [Palaemon carinicauda]|uniref:nucleolar protein 58-like n=1 Tax=Palaemon carinicauda TaxID=392227 RepID=UPI0035B5A48A